MMTGAYRPGSGLRSFTAASAAVTKLCQEFQGLDTGVTPAMVLLALKRAAPYIGLSLRQVSLIDTLFAWTKPQDWTTGIGVLPTVWPRNELLAHKLGVSVRQVQKLLNDAQQRGLIAFHDSPNGARGGQRKPDGSLRWAYGIVLAPLGARYSEFIAASERGLAEDAILKGLQKRLAAARRRIRSLAQTVDDANLSAIDAQEDLALALTATKHMRSVRDVPLLTSCVTQIETRMRVLEEAVITAITAGTSSELEQKGSCSDDNSDALSTTTIKPLSANAGYCSGHPRKGSEAPDVLRAPPQSAIETDLDRHGIDPSVIAALAPDLCREISYGPRAWGSLIAAGERLAVTHGISRDAWRDACMVMGERGAAASVIATIQKYRTGIVRRPGAYLRGMTGKAQRGELNLGRTLHGLRTNAQSDAMVTLRLSDDTASIGYLARRFLSQGTAGPAVE